jgi:hypothetical protein
LNNRRPLNRAQIDYAVTGGLAAIVYGHPRLTLDVDVVIRLGKTDAATFASLWSSPEFYCQPNEIIETESARATHGHFKVIHHESAMRADVYLAGSDPLQAWALEHYVEYEIQGERVRFAPLEYVIFSKLRYAQIGGSDRHLRDVVRILEVNPSGLEQSVLDRWIRQFGLADLWARAQALVGRE